MEILCSYRNKASIFGVSHYKYRVIQYALKTYIMNIVGISCKEIMIINTKDITWVFDWYAVLSVSM